MWNQYGAVAELELEDHELELEDLMPDPGAERHEPHRFCFGGPHAHHHPRHHRRHRIQRIANAAVARVAATRHPLLIRLIGHGEPGDGGLALARARKLADHLRGALEPLLSRLSHLGFPTPVAVATGSAAGNGMHDGRRCVTIHFEPQTDPAGPSLPGQSEFERQMEMELGESEGPTGYPFTCTDNCPLGGGVAECRTTYRLDLAQAIRMARGAAAMLERKPRPTDAVRNIYRNVFGHFPERPVPWAKNAPSGIVTARRLRMAANALEKGFFPVSCDACVGHPTANAVTHVAGPKTRIGICASYWGNADRSIRAGVLIHETLHAYFEFINDARTPAFPTTVRRTNAHCYEALVMLLHGITPDNFDVTVCAATPS